MTRPWPPYREDGRVAPAARTEVRVKSALVAASIPAMLGVLSGVVSLFVDAASLGLLVFGCAVPVTAVLGFALGRLAVGSASPHAPALLMAALTSLGTAVLIALFLSGGAPEFGTLVAGMGLAAFGIPSIVLTVPAAYLWVSAMRGSSAP